METVLIWARTILGILCGILAITIFISKLFGKENYKFFTVSDLLQVGARALVVLVIIIMILALWY